MDLRKRLRGKSHLHITGTSYRVLESRIGLTEGSDSGSLMLVPLPDLVSVMSIGEPCR
jgi:hypothetical protein